VEENEQTIEGIGSRGRCMEMGWRVPVYHCRFSDLVVALGWIWYIPLKRRSKTRIEESTDEK
jgi:hypothetical protein